jgi:hypothetical protein
MIKKCRGNVLRLADGLRAPLYGFIIDPLRVVDVKGNVANAIAVLADVVRHHLVERGQRRREDEYNLSRMNLGQWTDESETSNKPCSAS